ncbi:ABC transporter ATP-binding protein/permease [Corynebacterium terpenotabidum]|uniref:ABC transporter ATPase/permease n=1 Tax=Corynebacterium terpenotabidum Y-11 TaxID=1200352 RepID=S4XJH9_9CORY|nr:ABC transporter transmembrane domain-containing protein [Corynebacterium terpenotabidum]AGP31905.1 ABC transporter ATPase/permease [Corynebacterium terpenotabidum Y-11]
MSTGPVNQRLLSLSAPTRRWILVLAVVTALRTGALVASGVLLGTTAAAVITDHTGLADHRTALVWLTVLVIVQAVLAWAEQRNSHRAAVRATEDLRLRALDVLAHRDPRTVDRAHWRTLLTEGVDGLGPYLTGYLPALVSTALATPAVLLVVWFLDAGSALIAVITLPLIPVFMWLVGTLTAGRTEKRLATLGVLSDQLLDLVRGLPTLRALGRLDTPVAEVRRLSDRHRRSTMDVLRIAFLSSMVLEFLATLSIALVAVGIGLRLVDGSMTLAAGLTVLIIIPEVYTPVRQVGARFHDARDGIVAVDRILALLTEEDAAQDATQDTTQAVTQDADAVAEAPSGPGLTVAFHHLSATGRDGARPRDVTGTAQPGQITALTGPNGAGKSTALLALLGIATDGVSGSATVTDVTTGTVLTGPDLWNRTSYLPQHPVLDATAVGDTSGLSLGQRQRVAVAAELDRGRTTGRDLLLLDEPTAHLDTANARTMLDTLARRAADGATVIIASHDPLVTAAADHRIEVSS